MLLRRVQRIAAMMLLLVSTIFVVDGNVHALESTNYRFDETAIGTNSLLQSSSDNFQINSATGDLGVGNAASENFQVEAGTQTSNDPYLSFEIITSSADFGNFSATAPSVTSTTFAVSNYTSYGYVIHIEGSPPTNGTHIIDPLETGASSQIGIEQFGINLVANTLPLSIGANPNNGDFGFGLAATNYNTPNQFRFVDGEIIATAPKSSGKTIYTMSYLVNVGALTPGGQYKSNQTVIVTGTY